MATKKDLIEAHAFTRRRLVTAFLSGAPGGREVEPSRPGRTVVGGLALAVLLVAGAAVASVLSPRTPTDWDKPGLLISKETGERYVVTLDSQERPHLRPVINVTSAQLILGVDVEPTIVNQDVLDGQTPGEDIGILGAPQQLPREGELVQSGWTSCVHSADYGMKVFIGRGRTVTRVPEARFLVRVGRAYYVIGEARIADATSSEPQAFAWRLSGANDDNLLDAIGVVSKSEAREVSPDWLALFPTGGELGLDTFPLQDRGKPVAGVPGALVGDYVKTDTGFFVYSDTRGGMVSLDDFEAAVYENSNPEPGMRKPARVDGSAPAEHERPPSRSASWPEEAFAEKVTGELCGQLVTEPGKRPYVRLATDPVDAASAADVDPGLREAHIDPGAGALVTSGDWSQATSGSTFVVDDNAKAYPLIGRATLEHLEYDAVDMPLVPDPWIKVLNPGVPLSTELALCTPAVQTDQPRTCE